VKAKASLPSEEKRGKELASRRLMTEKEGRGEALLSKEWGKQNSFRLERKGTILGSMREVLEYRGLRRNGELRGRLVDRAAIGK